VRSEVAAPAAPPSLCERRLADAARLMARDEPEAPSLAEQWASLPEAERDEILGAFKGYDWPRLLGDWRVWARPTQLAPEGDEWLIWMILAGRGWGKTHTGAQWIREEVESRRARSIGLVAPTFSDAWDQMVYGDEGAPGIVRLFDYLPQQYRPTVNRNDKKIFFHTGAQAKIFSAEEPEIRGPNTTHWWCDELAKWKYLQVAWDNIQMTNRAVGKVPPRICITTTPRPLPLIKELLDDADVAVTFGSTFANAANLHPAFLARMRKKFAGSRLGRQELFGLVLGDNPDGLFRQSWIDAARWTNPRPPRLVRTVVAVDPAISTKKGNDVVGIVVCGLGEDEEIYVLADYTGASYDRDADGLKAWFDDEPRRHTPEEWGELVIRAREQWNADAIIVERNRGGDLCASNLRQVAREYGRRRNKPGATYAAALKIEDVLSIDNKERRAEPVSTLCQQGALHFVGALTRLESEITEWNPKITRDSPNGLDAMVHACYALARLGEEPAQPPSPTGDIAEANRRFTRAEDYGAGIEV